MTTTTTLLELGNKAVRRKRHRKCNTHKAVASVGTEPNSNIKYKGAKKKPKQKQKRAQLVVE